MAEHSEANQNPTDLQRTQDRCFAHFACLFATTATAMSYRFTVPFSYRSNGAAAPAPVNMTQPLLNWRMNPDQSYSDWTLYVTVRETGITSTYHLHKCIVGAGPRKSDFLISCFQAQEEMDDDESSSPPKRKTRRDATRGDNHAVSPNNAVDNASADTVAKTVTADDNEDAMEVTKTEETDAVPSSSSTANESDAKLPLPAAKVLPLVESVRQNDDGYHRVTESTDSAFASADQRDTTHVTLGFDAAQALPLLLDFIYPEVKFAMDQDNLTVTTAIQLHNVADFFQVEGLIDPIKNFLRRKLEWSNLVDYVHATRDHERFTQCYNFIATDIAAREFSSNFGENSEEYYQRYTQNVPDFLSLAYDVITGKGHDLRYELNCYWGEQEAGTGNNNNNQDDVVVDDDDDDY